MSYADYLINAALWLFMLAGLAGAVYGVAIAVQRHDECKTTWPLIALATLSVLAFVFCFATIAYRSQS